MHAQVVDYKGVQGVKKYIPYSEYNTMRFGDGKSAYWHEATMKHLRRHLDLPLETSLGYFYNDIFNRRAAQSVCAAHPSRLLQALLSGSACAGSMPHHDTAGAQVSVTKHCRLF